MVCVLWHYYIVFMRNIISIAVGSVCMPKREKRNERNELLCDLKFSRVRVHGRLPQCFLLRLIFCYNPDV
uniref:Putative secreted protein n=1 Tax=Ixodes ricinus TaxID=34613 RepID=A0A6B0U052_IXORI